MFRSILTAGTYLVASTAAFPHLARDTPSLQDLLGGIGQDAVNALDGLATAIDPEFNEKAQRIDVSGIHEWRAPGPLDARGPCPGLNALANHGYLPRNGLASIVDLTLATTSVYGMGVDLAAILSAYGAVFDGAIVGWSIGGHEHTGISGSHNNYETDSSPMRADLNQYGSNVDLVVSQFKDLYDMQPDAATANYNIDVLGKFREKRYNDSVSKNPNFFYGPFSGTAVSQAAFVFIYRFFANHTEANPEGILNQDNLKSFYGVTGPSDNLKWTPGHERIPENWYRRSLNDSYGLSGLTGDIGTLGAKYPFVGQPGCNMGKVNTFTPIDTADTDASAYDFANPVDSICYGVASAIKVGLNIPVVSLVVTELLLPVQNALKCTTLPDLGGTVGDGCPGYSFYGGPTGKVAPGAIQD